MPTLADILGQNNAWNRSNSGYDPLRDGAKMSEGDMWRISDPRGISPDYYTPKSMTDMIITDLLKSMFWSGLAGGGAKEIEKKPRDPNSTIQQNTLGSLLGGQ